MGQTVRDCSPSATGSGWTTWSCARASTRRLSKLFEMLAAGRPVIGAVRGEARDILARSGGALLVEPERGDQLAEAVDRLRADPSLQTELARRGRAFAEQHYDRDTLAARYLELLRTVVGQ